MEKVIEKILEEAKGMMLEIEARGIEESKNMLKETENKISEIEENAKSVAWEKAKVEKERLLALSRVENRKGKLLLKRKLCDEVFEEALKALSSGGDYKKWMMNLFHLAVESGEEEVLLGKNERVMDKAFLKEVNDKIRKNGKEGNLRLSPDRIEIQGGFILRKDRIEINVSLETLHGRVREELEIEVGRILFQETSSSRKDEKSRKA
jgi:V/A-type H+-transporting ATPase subunit E